MKKSICLSILIIFPFILWGQEKAGSSLEQQMLEMYDKDQAIRVSYDSIMRVWAGKEEQKEKSDSVLAIYREIDRSNQSFLANILDSIGWPTDFSFKGNMAIFMIIQHSGKDYMAKYAPLIEQKYETGIIVPSLYAIFKDRLLMRDGKKQLYGSQIYNGYVWPIEDEDNVDKRRSKMDLIPIQDYIDSFRKNGISIIWKKDMTVDEISKIKLKK